MIIQGSNTPILFKFDYLPDYCEVGLFQNGKELKHWSTADLTHLGDYIVATITQNESVLFAEGNATIELKWLDSDGVTNFNQIINTRIVKRDDKTIMDDGDYGAVRGDDNVYAITTLTGVVTHNGKSPYIDPTTETWFEYDDKAQQYFDTGIVASGVSESVIKALSKKVDDNTSDIQTASHNISVVSDDVKTINSEITQINSDIQQINSSIEQIDVDVEQIKKSIPTKVSQLSNDSNYTSKDYVDNEISDVNVKVTNVDSKLSDTERRLTTELSKKANADDLDNIGTEVDNLSLSKQDKLTAGSNISISNTNVISSNQIDDNSKSQNKTWSGIKIQSELNTKQDNLSIGDNIHISEDNVISATDTTYTSSGDIKISDRNVILLDLKKETVENALGFTPVTSDDLSDAIQVEIDERQKADTKLSNTIGEVSANVRTNYYDKTAMDSMLEQKADNGTVSALNTLLRAEIAKKQDTLIAGENITIKNNVISSTGGSGTVTDVQVNGTSVLTDGVANIPLAKSGSVGVIKPTVSSGFNVNSSGELTAYNENSYIDNRYGGRPLALNKLDYAVKAALTDTKAITYTDEEMASARTRLGSASNDDLNALSAKVDDLSLFKFPNATIIGEPTINNGQISNFSVNDYLKFPFLVDFKSKPFVINMEFTTGSNVTSQENIFDSIFGLAFAVRSGKFVIAISTNGTSWNLGEGVGTHTITANTTYKVRLSWNKIQYKLEYSTDGGDTYITDITKASTVQPYPKQINIGVGGTTNFFSGTINLNHCDLYVDNTLVWQGMDDVGLATRLATDLSNVDSSGEQKIKDIVEKELTQSEYDSLSEEEKLNGTVYYVKDSDNIPPVSKGVQYYTFTVMSNTLSWRSDGGSWAFASVSLKEKLPSKQLIGAIIKRTWPTRTWNFSYFPQVIIDGDSVKILLENSFTDNFELSITVLYTD